MKTLKYLLLVSSLLSACALAGPIPENNLKWGDGTAGDKTLTANKGLGSTNPKIKYNNSGSKWQFSNDGSTFSDFSSGGTANLSVVSKTANYTLSTSDDVVLGNSSGGTFTLTLPTAVGNTGKVFRMVKTDSTFTAVSIATTSSQTIDGLTTSSLNSQYEALAVVSDGSNWQSLGRKIDQTWKTCTMTIQGSVSDPTKGTLNSELCKYRRIGGGIEVQWDYDQASGGADGSGDYLFNLFAAGNLSGLTIDTALVNAQLTSHDLGLVGVAAAWTSNGGWSQVVSSTQLKIQFTTGGATAYVRSAAAPLSGASKYSMHFMIPISGWKGN